METNTQPLSPEIAKGIMALINRTQLQGSESEAVTRIKQIVASYIPITVTTSDEPQDQEQEADREASE